MSLSITNAEVKSCWEKIKSETGEDFFIDQFYQLMFSKHPETEKLFSKDLTEQKRILLATLDNVINGIKYISELEGALFSLGQHHKAIGVTEDMFEIFNEIIVETADIASHHRLSKQELDAWKQAFQNVSNIMLRAY